MSGSGRGIPRRALDDEIISPAKLIPGLTDGTYLNLKFPGHYISMAYAADGPPYVDPTGVADDENIVAFAGPLAGVMRYFIIGTQALTAPQIEKGATGEGRLVAGLDETLAEGVAYVPGGDIATVGASPAAPGNPLGTRVAVPAPDNNNFKHKFIRVKLAMSDVSEVAEMAVGWVRTGLFDSVIDAYEDLAVINVQAGVVSIETITNDDVTISTPTPDVALADDVDIDLKVEMYIDGTNRFYVNGIERFSAPALQWLNRGVVPFIHFLNGGGTTSLLFIKEIECGTIEDTNESLQF